jgi:peptide/nickel transport system substrate-binding protein
MTPSSSYYCRSSYDGRRGVKVLAVTMPDPYTVVFSLAQPSALFLPRMSDPRCPLAILNHESVDAQGKWIKPIGTGPYVFSAWIQGRDVLLTPFAGYRPRTETPSGLAGAKRGYDNVRFVVIPDEASQLSAFMAGQIDAMNVSENNMPEPSSDWSLVSGPGADPAALLMQTRDPLLADVRIRRAIALATDMPAITHAVSAGKADYNPSLIPVADAMYSKEEAVGYQKNLTEVKSLLEQAHYHGQVITLETNRRYAHMYSLAVYMQSLLSQAGINVRLQVVEWGTQISDFRAGRFQLMAFGYSARIDPALMYADVLGNKDRNPMLQWENPEASALLKTVETETDDADRQRIFAQLHALMLRDVPMLVFYHSPDLLLVSRHLHGVSSWPMRLKRFFNVTKD